MTGLIPGRYVSRVLPLDEQGVVVQLDVWFTGQSIDTVLMAYPVTEHADETITRTHRAQAQRHVIESKPVKGWRRDQFIRYAATTLCDLDNGGYDTEIYDLVSTVETP